MAAITRVHPMELPGDGSILPTHGHPLDPVPGRGTLVESLVANRPCWSFIPDAGVERRTRISGGMLHVEDRVNDEDQEVVASFVAAHVLSITTVEFGHPEEA